MRIQKDRDFLAISGNSVLAIKAARMVASSVGHHVPLSLLIRQTILQDLDRAIDEHGAVSMPARDNTFSTYLSIIANTNQSSSLSLREAPLSYLEEEPFRSHHMSDTKSAFKTSFQFVMYKFFNQQAFAVAFHAAVREKSILRACYRTVGEAPRRIINDMFSPSCCTEDGRDVEKRRATVNESFNLANDELFKNSSSGTEVAQAPRPR
ncbi:hypothetical protein HD806DRAFT_487888 [Xylariaceae sp. AK1471]|nr:hypothetical protein HD806DRAFT_487888 [Xylariaceae sp. AK1471]